MDAVDILAHLTQLVLPGLGLASLSAALVKLLWRRELGAVSWHRLAWPAGAAGVGTTLVGLWVWGQDGRMATYALMVTACALCQGWLAFGPRRRSSRR